MHRTLVRRLHEILLGAAVCIATAWSPIQAADGPLLFGSGQKPSAAAADKEKAAKPDGPILLSAATEKSEKAANSESDGDKQGPTLAPLRSGSSADIEKRLLDSLDPPEDSPRKTSRTSDGPKLTRDLSKKSDEAPSSPLANEKATVSPGSSKEPREGKDATEPSQGGKSIRPIPDSEPGPNDVETASFNGITPGASTQADVEKEWGKPKDAKTQGDTVVQLYKVEPFERVEVACQRGKVASIVIRLEKVFPAEAVAQQLALSKIRPVLVSNDRGEILGECFPERGVVFSFEPSPTPGKASMKVAQIILEPVAAEPFLLRAETNLDTQPDASLRDLDQALKFSPGNARVHWLRCRLLVLLGDVAKAMAAADESVRLEPKDTQFRLTKAQVYGQAGRFTEAVKEAELVIAASDQRPHIKARAECLMGDLLGSGPEPDYKRAVQLHSQAIATAISVAGSPHPALRLPAKEVLVDAHLGAAHDIAWGNFKDKQAAVQKWLEKAAARADDLLENDGGTSELRLRVATRALAACVGAQGKIDPGPWAEQVVREGKDLLASAGDAAQKQQLQAELGMALYDAVQVYQMRGDLAAAVKYGEQAIAYLEGPPGSKGLSADAYLLGRLYFRLGSMYAIGEQNHKAAITWFDKAAPTLQKAATQVAPFELGRLGETFVSMGVSYWETGSRDKAVKLTQQGIDLMERAVKEGQLPRSALEIPNANLITMQRHLGQEGVPDKPADRTARKPAGVLR